MSIPKDYFYTKEHEWLCVEKNNVARVGITDFAQKSLGDITYLELPKKGDTVTKSKTFGVVESVKAVSDLYSPVTGKVVDVNILLLNSPEKINLSPYEEAWMLKVEYQNLNLDELLTPEKYIKLIES